MMKNTFTLKMATAIFAKMENVQHLKPKLYTEFQMQKT
jgi:hypothetical protein